MKNVFNFFNFSLSLIGLGNLEQVWYWCRWKAHSQPKFFCNTTFFISSSCWRVIIECVLDASCFSDSVSYPKDPGMKTASTDGEFLARQLMELVCYRKVFKFSNFFWYCRNLRSSTESPKLFERWATGETILSRVSTNNKTFTSRERGETVLKSHCNKFARTEKCW